MKLHCEFSFGGKRILSRITFVFVDQKYVSNKTKQSTEIHVVEVEVDGQVKETQPFPQGTAVRVPCETKSQCSLLLIYICSLKKNLKIIVILSQSMMFLINLIK